MSTVVLHTSTAVTDRLAMLGLTVDVLRDAVAMGEAARNSCTANDPSIAPGFLAWAKTTRGLRDALAPANWRRSSDGGLEAILSPDGNLAIVVATGDEGTESTDRLRRSIRKGPQRLRRLSKINSHSPLRCLRRSYGNLPPPRG